MYRATLTIESLWAAGVPASVSDTLHNYPDGTLLKGSGSQVFVIRGGLKRNVPNPATFAANGLNWSAILTIPDSILDALPAGQPLLDVIANGNLLKGTGQEVYVMDGGLKRHVADPGVLDSCHYGWDAVYTIHDSLLTPIPTGGQLSGAPCPPFSPPSGRLVNGTVDTVYVMAGGLKRGTPNPATFAAKRFQWGDINLVPDSSLALIPAGQPLLDVLANGNLLKGTGPEVYVMDGGLKRHVADPGVLDGWHYGWEALCGRH